MKTLGLIILVAAFLLLPEYLFGIQPSFNPTNPSHVAELDRRVQQEQDAVEVLRVTYEDGRAGYLYYHMESYVEQGKMQVDGWVDGEYYPPEHVRNWAFEEATQASEYYPWLGERQLTAREWNVCVSYVGLSFLFFAWVTLGWISYRFSAVGKMATYTAILLLLNAATVLVTPAALIFVGISAMGIPAAFLIGMLLSFFKSKSEEVEV